MKLVGLVVENFRCFGQEEFQFTDQTVIRAMNGSGKSSVAEAVAWCLYGTNILGKSKADQNLMQNGANSMKVITTWETTEGPAFTVERIKPAKGATKVFVNGATVTPGQIEGLFFPTVNEFLSVFVPGFFSSLEPKDAKAILARYSDVTPDEVLSKLLPKEREALDGVKFGMGYDSIEVFRKKVADELKQAEAEKLRLEGEIRSFEEALEQGEPEKPEFAVTEEHLQTAEKLRKQISRAELQASMGTEQLNNLKKQHEQIQATYKTVERTLMVLEENCPTCGQTLDKKGKMKVQLTMHSHNTPIQKHLTELQEQSNQLLAQIEKLEQQSSEGATVSDEKLEKWRNYVTRVEQEADREYKAKTVYDAQLQVYEKAKANLNERKEWLIRQDSIIGNLKSQLEAVKAFRFNYVKVQQAKLDVLFEKVHIQLTRVNEDGEMKDAFQITWNKKPYQVLSTSEKVRCDLEIGRAISALRANPEPMPVFVDNAEGVQNLFTERLERQTIAAYVFESQLLIQAREDAVHDIEAELKHMHTLLGATSPMQKGA